MIGPKKLKDFKFKSKELRFDYFDEDFFPEVHPNCKCEVVDGEWIFEQTETGPCELCIEASEDFAVAQGRGFSKMKRIFKIIKDK